MDLSLKYLSIVDDIFALVSPWNRRRYPTFACDMCTSIRLELVTEGGRRKSTTFMGTYSYSFTQYLCLKIDIATENKK